MLSMLADLSSAIVQVIPFQLLGTFVFAFFIILAVLRLAFRFKYYGS
jgi:uncharacterized membrane protein